ncbi:MAG: protein kinase [Gemmatimonadota bacterium]|nr:protein kinase [Gemmatimonadota bacterium]
MDPRRWREVERVFSEALERAEPDRDSFLAERCGDDATLRSEVESLLAAAEEGRGYFDDLGSRMAAAGDPALGGGDAGAAAPSGVTEAREALEADIGERYRIDSLLDRGGMGLVFRAVDRKHGRPVAIKTIHPELGEALGARFEREIRITAGLQHPNVLPLLDSGVAGGIHFYIMPYVEGESLKDRLDREGRLPPGEAIRIALDVAGGLEHAHARGVLHRDIKPGNILLGEGQVQIVDFGIARAMVELGGGELTETGFGIGTPNYMAPEQFIGEATSRSDVYSLGAVLYEMLTGRTWRTEAVGGEPDWRHVPSALKPILTRALEIDPGQRFAEVSELSDALRDWKSNARGGPAGGDSVWDRLRRLIGRRESPSADSKSIAVLPFENLMGDEETEYFSDGITEDIIAQLSRIGELKVISRTSVMRFKGADVSIPEIGRELDVAHVLEGSVRRSGDRVRVVSQLIEVRTDEPRWSQTFDRELTDIFEIQSEVARRIADALRARITDTEASLIRRRPTEDVEAHDLYLKGRHLWNRRTRSALESAEEQFRRAIARDPLFAPAYAGLADVYLLLASYRYRPEIEAIAGARTAVKRALELDPDLADAHATLGQIRRGDRDWAAEEGSYRRAIELNPNYATAHQWYAALLSALGLEDEAAERIGSAAELDPLSPAIRVTQGVVKLMARDYEAALDHFERTARLAPRFFSTHAWLSLLWSELGEFDRAMAAWGRMRDLIPDERLAAGNRAYVLAAAGRREEALSLMEDAGGPGRREGVMSGIIHGLLGEADEAFHHLERALADASWRLFTLERSTLFYLKVGPWFDALRDDPRFEGLLHRMNMAG